MWVSPGGARHRAESGETVLVVEDINDLLANAPRGWRVHRLSGDRQGEWSVSVSGNWRITFKEADGGIEHLHLEDYH